MIMHGASMSAMVRYRDIRWREARHGVCRKCGLRTICWRLCLRRDLERMGIFDGSVVLVEARADNTTTLYSVGMEVI